MSMGERDGRLLAKQPIAIGEGQSSAGRDAGKPSETVASVRDVKHSLTLLLPAYDWLAVKRDVSKELPSNHNSRRKEHDQLQKFLQSPVQQVLIVLLLTNTHLSGFRRIATLENVSPAMRANVSFQKNATRQNESVDVYTSLPSLDTVSMSRATSLNFCSKLNPGLTCHNQESSRVDYVTIRARRHSVILLGTSDTRWEARYRYMIYLSLHSSGSSALRELHLDDGFAFHPTFIESLFQGPDKLAAYLSLNTELASHHDKTSSTSSWVTPGFSQVGIVLDDAASRRVFSGISRFPCYFISALLHTHLVSPSSALYISLLRAVQISSLAHSLKSLKNRPDQRHRPARFPHAINPGATPPKIKPGSHRWEANRITTTPPWPLMESRDQARSPRLRCSTLVSLSLARRGISPKTPTAFNPPRSCEGEIRREGFAHTSLAACVIGSCRRRRENNLDDKKKRSGTRSREPMRAMDMSMEQRRNERTGETEDPRENPPTNGIVRHDSYMRKFGVTRPGIEPTAFVFMQPSLRYNKTDVGPFRFRAEKDAVLLKEIDDVKENASGEETKLNTDCEEAQGQNLDVFGYAFLECVATPLVELPLTWQEFGECLEVLSLKKRHSITTLNWPPCSPDLSPIERLWDNLKREANRVQSPAVSLRIFASGNRAGRCRWSAGFLGDIPFPPPFHFGAAPFSPRFTPSSALKTSVKSRPSLSSLTHSY
ncbi:hypothetical protein PR048_026114 [Dryococelus australis]|uniref:Uncharacterized protein n=1 Tax=Dryococelus australis TaxID=614101 RepID=A0ABQ9GKE7_9NEOP|nr:hypothetical protein PR048_026114 [Dryococelus australis]